MGRKYSWPEDQLNFLRKYIDEYLAIHKSKKAYEPFWAKIRREYNEKFSILEQLFPSTPEGSLTAEELVKYDAHKQAVLTRIYGFYRREATKSNRKLQVIKTPNGSTLKTRRRAFKATEVYSKMYFKKRVKDDYEAEKKRLNLSNRQALGLKTRMARKQFEKEDEEIIKKVLARTELENKKLAEAQDTERTPLDYQRAIDDIPSYLRSVLSPLSKSTGYTFTVLMGGPTPKSEGKLRTGCFHQLATGVVTTYAEHTDDFESRVIKPFGKYLKTEYESEVCKNRAMTEDHQKELEASEQWASSSSEDDEDDEDSDDSDAEGSSKDNGLIPLDPTFAAGKSPTPPVIPSQDASPSQYPLSPSQKDNVIPNQSDMFNYMPNALLNYEGVPDNAFDPVPNPNHAFHYPNIPYSFDDAGLPVQYNWGSQIPGHIFGAYNTPHQFPEMCTPSSQNHLFNHNGLIDPPPGLVAPMPPALPLLPVAPGLAPTHIPAITPELPPASVLPFVPALEPLTPAVAPAPDTPTTPPTPAVASAPTPAPTPPVVPAPDTPTTPPTPAVASAPTPAIPIISQLPPAPISPVVPAPDTPTTPPIPDVASAPTPAIPIISQLPPAPISPVVPAPDTPTTPPIPDVASAPTPAIPIISQLPPAPISPVVPAPDTPTTPPIPDVASAPTPAIPIISQLPPAPISPVVPAPDTPTTPPIPDVASAPTPAIPIISQLPPASILPVVPAPDTPTTSPTPAIAPAPATPTPPTTTSATLIKRRTTRSQKKDTTPPPPERSASPDIAEAPEWAILAKDHLLAQPLGDAWPALVMAWFELEDILGFGSLSGVKTGLPTTMRPSEWSKWTSKSKQGLGRVLTSRPSIQDPAEVGAAIVKWWNSIQPVFRQSDSGMPLPTITPPSDDPDSWTPLCRPGPNGLVSILLLMEWWGLSLPTRSRFQEDSSKIWLSMVLDVTGVLLNLKDSGSRLIVTKKRKTNIEGKSSSKKARLSS